MKVAMMQPSFLPWQGFFELIYQSERFIFLDDFQFSVQSYHQRNRLFLNQGQIDWYTVPIQKSSSFKLPINEVMMVETNPWRSKMWKRIRQNYSRAEYYDEMAPSIGKWLMSPAQSLAENNLNFIMIACRMLGLERDYRFSSQLPSDKRRSERVFELLQWCEADRYYCARGSFDYMLEDGFFPVDGIDVLFQDYKTKAYPQVGCEETFHPYLSILDSLMNIGPTQTMELIMNGTEAWRSWEDMIAERTLRSSSSRENPDMYRGIDE